MKRRAILLSCVLVAIALGTVLLSRTSRSWLLGHLRNEPFYEGMPLSFWLENRAIIGGAF